jgi:hypothetical protein
MVLNANTETVRLEFETFIKEELLKTWVEQGHNINGKVVKEMDIIVEQTVDKISFLFFSLPYGVYIAGGVSADKIPFSGIGGGGKSAYIQGLISYAKKKLSLPDKEAKSAAFAIAYTHKKRGMPSPASSKFSSTGERTNWIGNTMERNEGLIRQFMLRYVDSIISVLFDNIILKYIKEFKTAV